MKTKILFTALVSFLFWNYSFSQITNDKPVPKGIYFIVNEAGGALQPLGGTVAQSVFLYKFKKSGMQKWEVIPQKTGGYIIKLYDSNLYLEPHPVSERSAILDERATGYKFAAAENSDDLWYIKSKARKGDAMTIYKYSPTLEPEIRFEPAENDKKFKWKLIPAE